MGSNIGPLVWIGVAAGVLALLTTQEGANVYGEKRTGILDGLDAETRAAAVRFADAVEAEGLAPVVFTSGRRSTLEQAGAMLYKLTRWGPAELFTVYKSSRATIDKLLAAPRNPAAWAAVLDASPPLSRHLAGRAVDVRRWGYDAAQLYRMGELAIAAGFTDALLEKDHLHLQR